jgi:acetyl-CoA synthetase
VGRRPEPQKHDLSSLRLLGTVGEPINPEAWMWYHEVIGGRRCPIVDTWWQTETGGIMITPAARVTTTKPGSATFGPSRASRPRDDDDGEEVGGGYARAHAAVAGHAAHDLGRRPALPRHLLVEVRPPMYFAGDGAKRDDDGYLWISGASTTC